MNKGSVLMKAGKLEMDVGGMYAEKSTNLIRKAKRKIRAGKKVVMLKPAIDDRYAVDEVVTHDGISLKAINVRIDPEHNYCDNFGNGTSHPAIEGADIVCIDEVQFFPQYAVNLIEELLFQGKDVYAAGLDMDRFGKPFGIVPYLMAKAEVVTKHNAVCGFCGADAWVTIGTEDLQNDDQVNVGNDYVPACRTCADRIGGVR
jgi:thymidine kinase